MRILPSALVVSSFVLGCGQSDEELCKDVQEKLARCGTTGPSRCEDSLADKVREQYECIMDTRCSEIHECAD
jgi:hypothetical protein